MSPSTPHRVAVVTGSRADFGLLTPVMHAVANHPALELLCIAAGSHLIQPAVSFRDVKALFPIADSVPMQVAGRTGRWADVESVAKGIARFGRSFERLHPDWVVVLGDRIEAFAAASAASIGGLAVAHIHGGDRAEGIADEAMRHAITKLAHLHFPATETSADRIRRMGEEPGRIVVTGSPAIDTLAHVEPASDDQWADLAEPTVLLVLHPTDRAREDAEAVGSALAALKHERVLALHPNHDPGHDVILNALRAHSPENLTLVEHLPRPRFLGVLKRLASTGGIMVGNSSAALIEAAALGLAAVNIGPRQAGRERAGNVIDALENQASIADALRRAHHIDRTKISHPYGHGRAGLLIAEALAAQYPHDPSLLRKRCTY